jgi:hypothetical protein
MLANQSPAPPLPKSGGGTMARRGGGAGGGGDARVGEAVADLFFLFYASQLLLSNLFRLRFLPPRGQ